MPKLTGSRAHQSASPVSLGFAQKQAVGIVYESSALRDGSPLDSNRGQCEEEGRSREERSKERERERERVGERERERGERREKLVARGRPLGAPRKMLLSPVRPRIGGIGGGIPIQG